MTGSMRPPLFLSQCYYSKPPPPACQGKVSGAGDVGIARCMEQGKTGELIKTKDPKSFRIWDLLARREGFEPPAFWSVGCLTHKSEPFRLRFVLFATVCSADFPLFPSSPARFFRILGQNWVRIASQAIFKAGMSFISVSHTEGMSIAP